VTPSDRGDIVLGWLTKLVVVLGVLGVLGFDGVALVQSRFQAADRATAAASAAATDFATTKDLQKAYDAAFATLADGDTIETKTFTVSTDGKVSLRLHHTAVTLLLHKVGPLKRYADVVGTGEARPAS
jgi:hypothetical protein